MMSASKIFKYQSFMLFIGVGLLLWAAIGLQLFSFDTPCPRCWEVRGVYLIILELLLFSLLYGYKEPLSLVIIMLFIIEGSYITTQQIITHVTKIAENFHVIPGYGAYATFFNIPLPYWNLVVCNLAIIYIWLMTYLSHRFNTTQYVCESRWSRYGVILWGISPLLVNAYLFTVHWIKING